MNQGSLVIKQLTFMHIYTHTHSYTHTYYLVYKCRALFLTLLRSLKHFSCLVQAWIIHWLVLCTTLTALHHAKPPTYTHSRTHTREPCLVSVLQRVCRWQFHTNTHTLEAQGTLQIKNNNNNNKESNTIIVHQWSSSGNCTGTTWGRDVALHVFHKPVIILPVYESLVFPSRCFIKA